MPFVRKDNVSGGVLAPLDTNINEENVTLGRDFSHDKFLSAIDNEGKSLPHMKTSPNNKDSHPFVTKSSIKMEDSSDVFKGASSGHAPCRVYAESLSIALQELIAYGTVKAKTSASTKTNNVYSGSVMEELIQTVSIVRGAPPVEDEVTTSTSHTVEWYDDDDDNWHGEDESLFLNARSFFAFSCKTKRGCRVSLSTIRNTYEKHLTRSLQVRSTS